MRHANVKMAKPSLEKFASVGSSGNDGNGHRTPLMLYANGITEDPEAISFPKVSKDKWN